MFARFRRSLMPVIVAAMLVPLVWAQPAAQRDPRTEAQDLLKPYRLKIHRDNKDPKEVLESMKVMEALAEVMQLDLYPQVKGLMSYRDVAVRVQMIKTLAAFGPGPGREGEERAEFFARGFQAPQPEVAVACMEGLPQLGRSHVKPHIPKYVEAIKHEDVRVRRAATDFVQLYPELDDRLIDMSIAALDDADLGLDGKSGPGSVSWKAMQYLSRHRTAAKHAAPALLKIIKGKKGNEAYQYLVVATLAAVEPEDPLPLQLAREWLKKTDNPEALLRGFGVVAALGPRAKDAVPDLIAVAKLKPFENPQVEFHLKLSLINTFARLGAAAKDALPTLGELAATNDQTLRDAARNATKLIVGDK